MKKLLRFLLICTLTIGLSACESNASNPQTTGNADADYLGKYLCTGITLDGLTMNPNGKWLELNADGTVTTFLTEEADEAEWKLEGENFTMTIAGKMVGAGTLQGNELSLEMMGMEYTFVQEGTGQDGQEASSSSGSFMETCMRFGIPQTFSSKIQLDCLIFTQKTASKAGSQSWIRKNG